MNYHDITVTHMEDGSVRFAFSIDGDIPTDSAVIYVTQKAFDKMIMQEATRGWPTHGV
jgi:hypothetical protein